MRYRAHELEKINRLVRDGRYVPDDSNPSKRQCEARFDVDRDGSRRHLGIVDIRNVANRNGISGYWRARARENRSNCRDAKRRVRVEPAGQNSRQLVYPHDWSR